MHVLVRELTLKRTCPLMRALEFGHFRTGVVYRVSGTWSLDVSGQV